MTDPSPWIRVNPGVAVAAGLDISPDAALDFDGSRRAAIRDASDVLAQTERLDRMVLLCALAQAESFRPHHALREVVECMRAQVYLGRAGTPGFREWDKAIAGALPALVANVDGSLVERLLARTLVDGIRKLAMDAGFDGVARASATAGASLDALPAEPSWAWARDANLGCVVTPGQHARLLRDAYGFEESRESLDALAKSELATETCVLRGLAREVGARLPERPETPEAVAQRLESVRDPAGTMLDRASRMTELAIIDFDRHLIALDPADRVVRPEATPRAMLSLVTEGEEYLAGGLTNAPQAFCFVTENKCGSTYTLANVVYHELAHCWNMLKASRESRDLPPALRVAGPLGTALLEGIATLREWEVYELYAGQHGGAYDTVFDDLAVPREVIRQEFEFDTRYWRAARLIRAMFDARVHGGEQRYGDFVRETAAATGFGEARIHGWCFSFFEKPGYAPCYAIGALKLEALQREAGRAGISRRDFNTRASSAGMVPPALWRDRIMET